MHICHKNIINKHIIKTKSLFSVSPRSLLCKGILVCPFKFEMAWLGLISVSSVVIFILLPPNSHLQFVSEKKEIYKTSMTTLPS